MDTKNLKILGLIGARSGSKSVPDKNIRPLAGKPLIGWIIEKAKKSKYLNRVVVSTDSEKYAGIARSFGAETPFLRPKELAADTSTDMDWVGHALRWLGENENYKPDIVVRMFPTVPLQAVEDIDSVVEELFKDPEADSAVVVAEAIQPPMKALKLINDGKGGKYLVGYFSGKGADATATLRQSYERAYYRANIIAFRPEVIAKTNSMTGDRVRPHIIPQERAIDIDNPMDFFIAEQLIKKIGSN